MSTFEAGDVVCLRTGGPKMVVVDSWGAPEQLTYVVMWHENEKILSHPVKAAGVKLVESADPEAPKVWHANAIGSIRRLCEDVSRRGWGEFDQSQGKLLVKTILVMLDQAERGP